MRVSDEGRATFKESNTNFTGKTFQMIISDLPASSWQILLYKKVREYIPAVIDVQIDFPSVSSFSSLEILDLRFCIVVGGASRVLSED